MICYILLNGHAPLMSNHPLCIAAIYLGPDCITIQDTVEPLNNGHILGAGTLSIIEWLSLCRTLHATEMYRI